MQGSAKPGAWRVRAKTEGGVRARKGIPTGGGVPKCARRGSACGAGPGGGARNPPPVDLDKKIGR
jgi:hypothetical protein